MNQGKLDEDALEISCINNKDEFKSAIEKSLKIPKGGYKTTYKRGVG